MPDQAPQFFRVSHRDAEDGCQQITLNGQPVGPTVERAHAGMLVEWFTGYMAQRTAQAAAWMGIDTSRALETQMHRVPASTCPSCGKGPGGPIVTVGEAPCPVCR